MVKIGRVKSNNTLLINRFSIAARACALDLRENDSRFLLFVSIRNELIA